LFLSLVSFLGLRLNAADYFVDVYSTGYSPSYSQIAPGDTVYWINQDDASSHTVTSANSLWTRGYLINYQDSFGLTFNGSGSYGYYDEIDGFSGTIVVSASAAPPNDLCGSAIAMSEGTVYTVNTAGATSTGDPVPPAEVWARGFGTRSHLRPTAWSQSAPATAISIRLWRSILERAVRSQQCLAAVRTTMGLRAPGLKPAWHFREMQARLIGYWPAVTVERRQLKIVATTSGTTTTWQEAQLPFDLGASIARPNTNLIHVVDSTNDRLLTLDTASGNFISSIRLYGKLAGSSLMSFSLDGQVLYVPLYSSGKLQVISLASLRRRIWSR